MSGFDGGAEHHNRGDMEQFLAFKRRLDKTFENVNKQLDKANKESNLKKWEESLADPWNKARLSELNNPETAEKFRTKTAEMGVHSCYIQGEAGTGKTFFALALVRHYIAENYIGPSQVYHCTEEDILSIIKSGFRKQDHLKKIMNTNNKVFIIDNMLERESYTEEELALWSLILTHISKNNLSVILTSRFSFDSVIEEMSLSPSCASKISLLIKNNIVEANNYNTNYLNDASSRLSSKTNYRTEGVEKAASLDLKSRRQPKNPPPF